MAGDIKISEDRWWMVAGWLFRSVMRAALPHIPDAMPLLKKTVAERMNGWNYLGLDEFTLEDRQVFLNALRDGYQAMKAAGPTSFGDPDAFPGALDGFAKLIQMIEEELTISGRRDSVT